MMKPSECEYLNKRLADLQRQQEKLEKEIAKIQKEKEKIQKKMRQGG